MFAELALVAGSILQEVATVLRVLFTFSLLVALQTSKHVRTDLLLVIVFAILHSFICVFAGNFAPV